MLVIRLLRLTDQSEVVTKLKNKGFCSDLLDSRSHIRESQINTWFTRVLLPLLT